MLLDGPSSVLDSRYRHFGPPVLIVILGLLFFAKLVAHPSWVLYSDGSDLLVYQIPNMRYLVSTWQRTGELPLWCPYSFAGMPLISDIQVGAFYPPHLLLYLLSEESIGPALSWLIVAHVIVAGWAMYLYARSRTLNPTCAMLSALGYMFAGKWLHHLLPAGQYVMVGLAWLPLILLLLERAMRRGRIIEATWAGVVLSLVVLASHPQVSFYTGLLIVLWTMPLAIEQAEGLYRGGGGWRAIVRALGCWFGVVAWCVLWPSPWRPSSFCPPSRPVRRPHVASRECGSMWAPTCS